MFKYILIFFVAIFAIVETVFLIRDIIRIRRNKSLTKKSELKGDNAK